MIHVRAAIKYGAVYNGSQMGALSFYRAIMKGLLDYPFWYIADKHFTTGLHMTDFEHPIPQLGFPGMTVEDLQFHQHEMAYGAVVIENSSSELPANLQERMSDWTATLKSTKHAVVDFTNGASVSVITGTPVGAAVFAKGDEREPTYEVSISMPGEDKDIRFYQTPEQVEAILSEVGKADLASTDWTMVADETDDNVPELVKAVYRKGGDLNRHLILLDDFGAGFFGLDLKPRSEADKVPDAHVDLQVHGDRILILFWDGDQRQTVTLTEENPADWHKELDEARNNPAGLVIDKLYHGELNGDGKFDRAEDD